MADRPTAPKIQHPYVFSVSQVEMFRTCPRKWAFSYIDKLEGKTTAEAQLGVDVHQVLQDYLEFGIVPNPDTKVGRIAHSGLHHLPPPKLPGSRVEQWFVLKFGVAYYRGLKDYELIVNGRLPMVLDHKTTKDFRWKKTAQELLNDTQSGIYAADAMVKTKAKKVLLCWVYYRTAGSSASEKVEVEISEEQVLRILNRVDQTAQKMSEYIDKYKRGEASLVPPNYSGCSAFGGCPFMDDPCNPKPASILRSMMAQKTVSEGRTSSKFLKDLGERKKAKAEGGKVKMDGVQSVNPPDRDEAEPPAPPAAKKIDGKWVQPVWDEAEFSWIFPGEDKPVEEEEDTENGEEEEEKPEVKQEEEKPKKTSKFLKSKDKESPSETNGSPAAKSITGDAEKLKIFFEEFIGFMDRLNTRLK